MRQTMKKFLPVFLALSLFFAMVPVSALAEGEQPLKETIHIASVEDLEGLAEKMEKLAVTGTSHIVFVIGGSLGLSDEVLSRADYRLSFSKMTFPHQLMRVILLEQIYRSYRILNHEPYHK